MSFILASHSLRAGSASSKQEEFCNGHYYPSTIISRCSPPRHTVGQSGSSSVCQIAPKCDPLFAAKNDPFDGAETGGARDLIGPSQDLRSGVTPTMLYQEIMKGRFEV